MNVALGQHRRWNYQQVVPVDKLYADIINRAIDHNIPREEIWMAKT